MSTGTPLIESAEQSSEATPHYEMIAPCIRPPQFIDVGKLPPIDPALLKPESPDIAALYDYYNTHLHPDREVVGRDYAYSVRRRAAELAVLSGINLTQIPIGPNKETLHLFPHSSSYLKEDPHNHTSDLKIIRIIPPEWGVLHTKFRPTINPNGEFVRIANTRVGLADGTVRFVETPLSRVNLEASVKKTLGPMVVGETIERGTIHTLETGALSGRDKGVVLSFVDKVNFAEPAGVHNQDEWSEEHMLSPEEADRLTAALTKMQDDITKGTLLDKQGEPIDATEILWTSMVYLPPGNQLDNPTYKREGDKSLTDMIRNAALFSLASGKAGLERYLFGEIRSSDI